jgi:heptosyltransferase-2
MRFHAFGDVIITLPYIQGLRELLPEARIDLLTVRRVEQIPRALQLFDQVHTVKGGMSMRRINFWTLLRIPQLLSEQYQVVLDMQNNPNSRRVRKLLRPESWTEYEKYASLAAGERCRLTIRAAGFPIRPSYHIPLKNPQLGDSLLRKEGWKEAFPLIVLNPAGFFSTRNWPLENYLALGDLFRQHFAGKVQFLLLGIARLKKKASRLEQHFGSSTVNLTGKTSQAEAFAILRHADLVISEDSGLMHMAWVSGIPTLALFGSTRSDWARPLGPHASFLDSSDLPCGNCMQAECIHGDVRCLTRYAPKFVFEEALSLLKHPNKQAT